MIQCGCIDFPLVLQYTGCSVRTGVQSRYFILQCICDHFHDVKWRSQANLHSALRGGGLVPFSTSRDLTLTRTEYGLHSRCPKVSFQNLTPGRVLHIFFKSLFVRLQPEVLKGPPVFNCTFLDFLISLIICILGAVVTQWLTDSPPTTAILVRSPAGSIPGGSAPGFLHVGILLDDAACRRVFSGYSRFPALAFQRRSILGSHFISCSGMTGTYGSQLESPSLRGPLASHQGSGSIPGVVAPGFAHVGIVPDDAAGRRVFLVISRFHRHCIPALLHTHLISRSSSLKTSVLCAAQISSLYTRGHHGRFGHTSHPVEARTCIGGFASVCLPLMCLGSSLPRVPASVRASLRYLIRLSVLTVQRVIGTQIDVRETKRDFGFLAET
ncbi:hypothetical protein PR048_017298 [Dryococelus australis]|uniref:Uncharacterized protein n=1 Tax=Dryococelus australis TaxID=614101 RepID=A0ABQ9H945_9NEOP|nr:hypothetical protein PR048_017298 [Dryococelus australis]